MEVDDVRWLAPARLIGKADRGLSIRIGFQVVVLKF